MNTINKLKKISLNSNMLKVLAIAIMVIDHIGYYFQSYIPNGIYISLRAIGRIAMPLFAFMIVQGFFHTSNLKKYISRVFSLAVITQIVIYVVSLFDKNAIDLSVNRELNVVFSYALSLITLWVIHEKKLVAKYDSAKNMFLKILLLFTILGIYLFIPFDYDIYVPILIILMYFIERLKISIYLQKQSYNMSIGKVAVSFITEEHIKLGYISLILLSLLAIIIKSGNVMYWYMLLSIVPIWLYNGEGGKKNKAITTMFYAIFPLQHFLIYLVKVIIQNIFV